VLQFACVHSTGTARSASSRRPEHPLSKIRLVRPAYVENLRCIGSACEETCCQVWSVPVDRVAYEKLQALPASPLRTLIDASILLAPQDDSNTGGFGPEGFAKIRMTASNMCPLLTEERLCLIQAQCGEGLLPQVCATYPRIVRSIGGIEEKALALSCPEAARTLLLHPIEWKRLDPAHAAGAAGSGESWAPPHYWPIQAAVLEVVRNRTYPLWQRLILLGILCHRLDALANHKPQGDVPAFLAEFSAAVAAGTWRATIEIQPMDCGTQLDAVLRLAGLLLKKSIITPRFMECVQAFGAGIGNGPNADLEHLTSGYIAAHQRNFAPFIKNNPLILENYLVNTILRCQFPFGRDGMKPGATPSMTREFEKLAAQFSLMRGLLIGVAGFHGASFCADHVVHTVQSASKHFDHHPEFPRLAHELLVESKLDGLLGISVLLRDPDQTAPRGISPAIDLPWPAIDKTDPKQMRV